MAGIPKPFRRNVRQFLDGSYSEGGRWRYVRHPAFAQHPDKYVRAFLLIQKDFQALFDYIEPADANLPCYSFRTHELLVRTCIEVEANFKAILLENGFARPGDWNMQDYRKVNRTHRLSSYQVKVPYWHGVGSIRTPFAAWDGAAGGGLSWYQAYNAKKHDRHAEFNRANFENLSMVFVDYYPFSHLNFSITISGREPISFRSEDLMTVSSRR
jgi:hypothetical protein